MLPQQNMFMKRRVRRTAAGAVAVLTFVILLLQWFASSSQTLEHQARVTPDSLSAAPFPATFSPTETDTSFRDVEYNRSDIAALAHRARVLLSLSVANLANPQQIATRDKLAQTLYPWLPNSLQQMPQQFMQVNSTGIVFAVGERYSDIALLAIRALREVVKSKLPIEVMYAGNEDLSPETRAKFDGLPNVTTVDLYTYFTSEQDNLRGFYMKPFALVASSFRYPILLDADVLFMKDPRLVTESPHFAEYGQVFYTDRTLPWQFFWPWWGPFGFMPLFIERVRHFWGIQAPCKDQTWFKVLDPHPTPYVSKLRFMTIRSHHEMESGVVAVDKGRTKVLHALLLACKLNSRVERESLEPVFNSGDKETFWMAWELLRVPFRFAPGYSGMIGSKGSSFLLRNHVCGSMLHMDENLEPFWWNGGVYANKFQADSSMVEYTHAAIDASPAGYMAGWAWDWTLTWWWRVPDPKHRWMLWGWQDPRICFAPQHGHRLIELTRESKEVGQAYVNMYKSLNEIQGGNSFAIE